MVFLDVPRSLAVARQDGSLDRLDLSIAVGPGSVRRLVSPSVPGRWLGRNAALSPDARLLAVVQPDDSVTVTDLGDAGRTVRIREPFVPPGQATRTSLSVAFTAGGALVVLSDGVLSASGFLTIWDVSDLGSPRLVVSPVESPDLLALSEDGSLAVRYAARTRGVELVDLGGSAGPQRVGEPIAIADEAVGLAVGLSPDGTVLAVAEGRRGVALWDLTNRSTPRRLPVAITGYAGVPGSLVFSPDGRTLAMTDSTDAGTWSGVTAFEVLLWDVSDPAQPRRLTSSSVIRVGQYAGPVVFSPDSTELATVDPEFAVEIWGLTHLIALRDSPRGAACEVVGRGLDQAEWSRFIPGEDFVDTCAA
jgi:WD40 repeat protein